MKSLNLILREYKRELTQKNLGNKLIAAFRNDTSLYANNLRAEVSKNPSIILQKIEAADPTQNKSYTLWLANQYIKNNGFYTLEDLTSTLSDALEKFDEMKRTHQIHGSADINQYTTKTLTDYVDQHYVAPAERSDERGDYSEPFSNNLFRVIVPHDETAAVFWGRGTKWCTSADNNNRFDEYKRHGTLYIILPKSPAYPGEKYQYFNSTSGVIADEKNNDLTVAQRVELQKRLHLYTYFKTIRGKNYDKDIITKNPSEIEYILGYINDYAKLHGYKIDGSNYCIVPERTSAKFRSLFSYVDDKNSQKHLIENFTWYLINVKTQENSWFAIHESIPQEHLMPLYKRLFKHEIKGDFIGIMFSKNIVELAQEDQSYVIKNKNFVAIIRSLFSYGYNTKTKRWTKGSNADAWILNDKLLQPYRHGGTNYVSGPDFKPGALDALRDLINQKIAASAVNSDNSKQEVTEAPQGDGTNVPVPDGRTRFNYIGYFVDSDQIHALLNKYQKYIMPRQNVKKDYHVTLAWDIDNTSKSIDTVLNYFSRARFVITGITNGVHSTFFHVYDTTHDKSYYGPQVYHITISWDKGTGPEIAQTEITKMLRMGLKPQFPIEATPITGKIDYGYTDKRQ